MNKEEKMKEIERLHNISMRQERKLKMMYDFQRKLESIHSISNTYNLGDIIEIYYEGDYEERVEIYEYVGFNSFCKIQDGKFDGKEIRIKPDSPLHRRVFGRNNYPVNYERAFRYSRDSKIIGNIINTGKFGIINHNKGEYWSDGVGERFRFHGDV